MNRSVYPFTAAVRRGTLIERLFALVLGLAFILAALLFDALLLAGVATVVLATGLMFGARSRWQKRRGRLAPADRTIKLSACDYEVIPRQAGVSSSTEDKAS
jgi:hypothetical protein